MSKKKKSETYSGWIVGKRKEFRNYTIEIPSILIVIGIVLFALIMFR